ncbi:flagellar export chaperone FlgN [Pseudothermotoga sp.]|nr:flagellar protein FlgN [Pseudothermotoga sp.]MDW8139126.1 flagellar export chaperone FlgN [Pseudothermotoga sp.]
MDELFSILDEEESFLLQIDQQLQRCELSLSSKNTSHLEETLFQLENLLTEFSQLDEKRRDVFEEVKRKFGLSDTINFFDFCKQHPLLMERLFKIVDLLKNLSHKVERLRSLSEFHQAYFDFIVKLLNPPSFSIYNAKARLETNPRRGFKAEG